MLLSVVGACMALVNLASGSYVPSNETNLFEYGWKNGSLPAQVESQNNAYFYNSLYSMSPEEPLPRLEVYPNNVASIAFNATDENYAYVLPLAAGIFDDSVYRIQVWCTFPLSGNYDVLPRILFYCLIITSLIFRRHNWLATAALGSAMTYAATAAVHMLILVARFKFGTNPDLLNYNPQTTTPYGDVDVFGCYPILAVAAIMLTPILNWSVSIRNSRAQPVVLCWALLVLTALVPAWLYFSPGKAGWIDWYLNAPTSFGLCPYSAARKHPDVCYQGMTLNYNNYNLCQCIDFCSTFSPYAPLRRGGNMVAWISRKQSEKSEYNKAYHDVLQINKFVLVFVLFQAMLGVLESQFTQAEVRNLIFRLMYLSPKDYIVLMLKGERKRRWLRTLRLGPSDEDTDKSGFAWKIRKQVARFSAAADFIIAGLFALLTPAIFVTTAVANELYIGYYPVSEHSDAVGAWSSWVSTGFVVFAGGVIRYREAWEDAAAAVIWKSWHWLAYDEHERPASVAGHSSGDTDENQANQTLRESKHNFFAEVISPFRHGWHSTISAYHRIAVELSMFRDWWKDPEKESKRNWEDIALDTEKRMLAYPVCPCHFCERHRKDDDDDDSKVRYSATWGQKLVSGLEKTYSQHKSTGGGRHSSYSYNKSLQSESERSESRLVGDYNLPQIPTSTPLTIDENEESYPFEDYPLQPEPAYGHRQHPGYEDLSQPRRPFMRQNSEQFELQPKREVGFRIPRKKVGSASGSPPIGGTSEYQNLLSRGSPQTPQDDGFGR